MSMDFVKKISSHLVENCGCDVVNLLNANDESAGQSVPHFIFILFQEKTMMELMRGRYLMEQSKI